MKNATVYNEAALSEGSERFYRGAKAGEATPSKGLVFSRDRADAAAYAAKIGGELSYVDVPNDRVAELKPAAHKPDARVIVSAELAQERRVAEAVEMAQVAPRSRGAGVARDRAAGGISGTGPRRRFPAFLSRRQAGRATHRERNGVLAGRRRRREICVQDRRSALLHRCGEGAHVGSSAVVEGAGDTGGREPRAGARAAGGADCSKGRARDRVDVGPANRGGGRTTIGERQAAEGRQGSERRDRGVKGGERTDVQGWRSEAPNGQAGSGRRGDRSSRPKGQRDGRRQDPREIRPNGGIARQAARGWKTIARPGVRPGDVKAIRIEARGRAQWGHCRINGTRSGLMSRL